MSRWAMTTVVAAVLGATGLGAQGPSPEIRARISAFVAAVNGTADSFEAMAQANFTPAALARRTPADRRQLCERLHADFGIIQVERVIRENDTLNLRVKGSTGLEATINLELEPDPPHRIAGLGIEVGGDDRARMPAIPLTSSMSPAEVSKALDDYVTPLVAADTFSGTILVEKSGTRMFERAYGLADRAQHVANTMATRFNIGSINKAFTKTAIGQLVARGKLALIDTVGARLPDYPNAEARAATIGQLLEHTAGIADFFGDRFAAAPKDRFRSNADYYAFVAPAPLTAPPGTKHQYCNGCYIVLGEIIARVSGQTYEDYIRSHVFTPAGMTTADFLHTDEVQPDMSIGYTHRFPGGDHAFRNAIFMHGVAGSGAGGAWAAASDLLAFDVAMRGERLLDAKMTAWFYGPDAAPVSGGAAGARAIGIAGGSNGVNAALESDGVWTVVVLANLDPPAAEQLARAVAAAVGTLR
jgi:CubicO group peptidase (beta-lactamase class C family)